MLQVVSGKLGEGKSLYAAWLIFDLVCNQRRRVATNIELTQAHPAYGDVYLIGSDEFPVVEEGGGRRDSNSERRRLFFDYFPLGTTYVIDEAHEYFDSQEWANMPKRLRSYFPQTRKRGDDLVLITQFPGNLWCRIHRVTQEFIWCVKDSILNIEGIDDWRMRVAYSLVPQRFHRYWRLSFGSMRMGPGELLRRGWFTFDEAQRIYGWYRTNQLVGVMAREKSKRDSAGRNEPAGCGE